MKAGYPFLRDSETAKFEKDEAQGLYLDYVQAYEDDGYYEIVAPNDVSNDGSMW